jgi:integrase
LALHLASLADAGYSMSSVERTRAAIKTAHDALVPEDGPPNPALDKRVRYVMKGIRRTLGVRPRREVEALYPDDVRAMLRALPDGRAQRLRSIRNRALIAWGFAMGSRRSELVALNVDDVHKSADGWVALIRRSKTDQEGAGREVGIPYGSQAACCPVRLLDVWLETRGTDDVGPLFCGVSPNGQWVLHFHRLCPRTVARTVQRAAKLASLDKDVAGHSLRSGLVSSAARAGKSIQSIQNQTGHRTLEMVLRYIRRESIFDDNAAAGIL